MLVALGLSMVVAAVPTVASASIALGTVVSANPANFTPNVASGAVYKFTQVGGTMYAGGAFSSVSTPAGVSPGGTFARSNIVAFNASTGVVSSFAPSVNGEVWALASNGTSLWIGGTFTSVNGVARRGEAPVAASGASHFDAERCHHHRPAAAGYGEREEIRPT